MQGFKDDFYAWKETLSSDDQVPTKKSLSGLLRGLEKASERPFGAWRKAFGAASCGEEGVARRCC